MAEEDVASKICFLRLSLLLADEIHKPGYSMADQYSKARKFCLQEDLMKKWGASECVIRTWTHAGWDLFGDPVFSAYLGERWEGELYYDSNGEYLAAAGEKPLEEIMEYPLSDMALSPETFTIVLPEMRLCLKEGVRQTVKDDIKLLESGLAV